jgi:hypothetical protein
VLKERDEYLSVDVVEENEDPARAARGDVEGAVPEV